MQRLSFQSYGIFILFALGATSALAFEYRSVSEDIVSLYDAPSAKAKKVYVMSRDYPVELVVPVEGWVKIREAGGKLAWIETKFLGEKRTVLVKVGLADIRQSPDTAAALVFQAQQNVVMELLEFSIPGWVKVKHRDGQSGFVRVDQIWGV